jgi:hypothetical protein
MTKVANLIFSWRSLLLLIGFSIAPALSAAGAEGSAKLEFTTISAQGRYSPKSVLAAWVTDSKTNFVKTISKYGSRRQRYLLTWTEARGTETTVDGVTGATRNAHEALTVTWDGCDAKKKPLPDGTYLLFVEFTDLHAQGPKMVVPVAKGTEPQTKTFPDQTNFKKIKLTYTPPGK